jgi:hypothetical protein
VSYLIANNFPLRSPLANIEFTFIPASNILSVSVNSKTSVTYGLYSRPSSKLSGQNGEVHYGTIKVPLALHFTRWFIALLANVTGGTNQLTSCDQSELNEFTPKEPGFQYNELNSFVLAFLLLANLSTLCGPHNSSIVNI